MAVLAFDVKNVLGKVQVEGGQVVGNELEDQLVNVSEVILIVVDDAFGN